MTEIKQFRLDGGVAAGLPRVAPQPPETLACDEPEQYRQLYFHLPSHKFRAGVWGSSPFATTLLTQNSHELVMVAQGEVIIADEAGIEHSFGVGDCFVIPGGMRRRWIHKTLSIVYFMAYDGGGHSGTQKLVTVDRNVELAPSTPPVPEMLLSPVPETFTATAYENPSRAWGVGVWAATPYHRKTIPFPRYEFMHLLDGAVSFTHPNGDTKRFSKGDTFIVPAGFIADWHNPVPIKKIFSVFRPPSDF